MDFKFTKHQAYVIVLVALLCIAGLEVVALMKGIDGALMATSMGLIFGIAGYAVGKKESSNVQKTPDNDGSGGSGGTQ